MNEHYKFGGVSIKKSNLFKFIALTIPFIFFLIIEILLRLFSYGSDFPLFVQDPNDANYLHMNYEVTKRYFSNDEFATTGHYNLFLKNKTSNTFRIFVQGESSAAGFPFDHGGSFHFMLEKRLQETFPDKNIEIINTGLTAICSYTLLDFADEIIAQKPDAILIYTGHNEYYGALAVGSTQKLGRIYGLVTLYLHLKHYRIVQLLKSFFIMATSGKKTTINKGNSTLMERMVDEKSISYNSSMYKDGLNQFSQNLDKLLHKYKEKNIPVFIGDLASNEKDQKPFISKEISPIPKSAVSIDKLMAIVKADSLSSLKHYLLGQSYLFNNDIVSAKKEFLLAKDYDLLRFRAPQDINNIIKQKAAKYHSTFVPVCETFQNHAPKGIIGNELMMEHLHPNIYGYFLLSEAFYESMKFKKVIGDWKGYIAFDSAKLNLPVTEVDSIYGSLLVEKLKSGWPFKKNVKMSDPGLKFKPKNLPEELALLLYYKKTSWSAAMSKLYNFYMEKKDYNNALKVAHAMILEFKNIYYSYEMAADVYSKLQNISLALHYYKKASSFNPSIDLARKQAVILMDNEQWEPAKKELQLISLMDPVDLFVKSLPGVIDTLLHHNENLKVHPDNINSLMKSGIAYFKMRKFSNSKELLKRAVSLDKNQSEAEKILKEIEVELKMAESN